MKILVLVFSFFYFQQANAVILADQCLNALQRVLDAQANKDTAGIAPHGLGWLQLSDTSSPIKDNTLIQQTTKAARNLLFQKQVEDLKTVRKGYYEKDAALLDAGYQAIKTDFILKDQIAFIAQLNSFKTEKSHNSRKINENAEQIAKLIEQLKNGFLKPSLVLVTEPLTKEAQILAALQGQAHILVGRGHEKTVESLKIQIALQGKINKELEHLADTSLAGVNKVSDLPDHMQIAYAKSKDLAETILVKALILKATQPQLYDAIIYLLHSHVVESGLLLLEYFEWSTNKKDRNDYLLFPIQHNLYKFRLENKERADQINQHDFEIAREWIVQELAKSH